MSRRRITTDPRDVAAAIDQLEGWPADPGVDIPGHRGSACPPPPFARVYRHARVIVDPVSGDESYEVDEEVLQRHAGKTVNVGGKPITIRADAGSIVAMTPGAGDPRAR